MNIFPALTESAFIHVREQIHSIVKIIGKVRETLITPIAKNDNLWISVVGQGVCTPPMPLYGELEVGLNLESLRVELANATEKYDSIEVNGLTQQKIAEELNSKLTDFGVAVPIDINGFDYTKVYTIHPDEAKGFLTQLTNYNTLLTEFHKRISGGVKTQICLWPHHFDNAFKWFSGRRIADEEEQMGIGVSNGDESYELPYIYMSLYPSLRKTNTLEFSEGALLHDTDWQGFILPYETVSEKKTVEEQRKLIEDFFDISFKSIQRGFSKR